MEFFALIIALLSLLVFLAFMTLIGHWIWVALAWLFRLVTGRGRKAATLTTIGTFMVGTNPRLTDSCANALKSCG